MDEPCLTVTTQNRLNLVNAEFIAKYNAGEGTIGLNDPASTLTTKDRLSLVFVEKHQHLMNPQYMNNGSGLDKPCFTLIASMSKAPPYLISSESGDAVIVIYDSDSEAMKKIKLFMATYSIVDIKMRMLKVVELKRIQGFPADYQLEGSQADQKKFIGNSVVPMVVKAWAESLAKANSPIFENILV